MKNLKTALLCAAAVTMMSAPAKAEENFYFKPYVGAEYQHTIVDYASVDGISFDDVYEDNFNGGAIYLGARIHDHLGLLVTINIEFVEVNTMLPDDHNKFTRGGIGDDLRKSPGVIPTKIYKTTIVRICLNAP